MTAAARAPGLSPDLATFVAAIEILSGERYRLDGRLRRVDEGGPLLTALEQDLYAFLIRRRADAVARGGDEGGRRHLARLSRANCGHGTWQPGWRIRRIADDGGVAVEKYGVRFHVAAEGVRCSREKAAPGKRCRVRIPAEMRALLPGFVVIWGDADVAEPEAIPWLVRCYWHLRPAGAARWVGVLTAGLNRRGIPFSLKTLSDPRSYRRADSGVLYLEPEHYPAARAAIRRCHREVREELRPEVPRLTVRLAPGLGVAEGPAGGDSFGQHRCRLIAAAVVRAFETGRRSAAARADAVAAAFRAAGLDPERPHLAPGSGSSYVFP